MKEVDYTDFTYWEMPTAERRKLDVGDIFMNQVKCRKCGWIIRSKNRHDYVTCKCGKTFVDGGSWYQRTNQHGEDVSVMYANVDYSIESAGEAGAQPPRPLPTQSQIKTKTKEQ